MPSNNPTSAIPGWFAEGAEVSFTLDEFLAGYHLTTNVTGIITFIHPQSLYGNVWWYRDGISHLAVLHVSEMQPTSRHFTAIAL